MTQRDLTSPLDKRLPLPGSYGIVAGIIVLVAALIRLLRLDAYLLGSREASWAYDAYSLFNGRPLPAGQSLPESGPFMLVWHAIPFYLFGTTDATARVGSALLGIGLVCLPFMMRPFLNKWQVLSIATIIALSPTAVFASRTVEPGIAAAFFAALMVVSLMRIGLPAASLGWSIVLGGSVAALYASGPLGVTTLIAVGVGIMAAAIHDLSGEGSRGAVGAGVRAFTRNRQHAIYASAAFLAVLLTLFTRSFSDFSALKGLGTTVTDWLTMMSQGTATVGGTFYFWAMMLYETFAVILAIVAVLIARHRHLAEHLHVTRPLFIGWFATALLLHSFASARHTGSAILVVLPVLILAGIGLGHLIQSASAKGVLQEALVGVLIVLVVGYSAMGAIGLAHTRGESGAEPLARDIPSQDAANFIDRVLRLSNDLSTSQPSVMDPTGRFGLNIKVTPEQEWPFTWYFREFPQFSVTPAAGFTDDTDVAIATNPDVMESVGLAPGPQSWSYNPIDSLSRMRTGSILKTIVTPGDWDDAWNYMIHREVAEQDVNRTITVGYSVRVVNKLTTNVGPFDLFANRPDGPGSALGQLQTPAGIAVDANGTIYIVNAGNARIDRYSADGSYLGIWNAQTDPQLALSWNGWQGATDIAVGDDGLIYIADTWNHAVIVVAPDGKVVRVLGSRGTLADITDMGSPEDQPGVFFGPRDVAVTDDRIYVTDTGNERVQIFSKDGTFVTAFGGFGVEDGQLIEPTGIAVAPDGTVWVADSGNARLQQFDAEGNWIETYPIEQWNAQTGALRLNSLAFSPDGVLFMTSPTAGILALVDGEAVVVENLPVQQPAGIAFDADGNLLVVDAATARVERVQPVLPAGLATPVASPAATPAD